MGGERLIPSVTRVFSKAATCTFFCRPTSAAPRRMQPLYAFVTFYRGQAKAFETPPLPVTEGLDPKSKAVPLRFSIVAGETCAGGIQLPGDGARSGRAKSGVLAGSGDAGAIEHKITAANPAGISVSVFLNARLSLPALRGRKSP